MKIMHGTEAVRKNIVRIGQDLLQRGLVAGTWGNISARTAIQDYIAITPSGRDYNSLSHEEIVIIDSNGSIIEGYRKPSSETLLHVAVYRARPDVEAIVHTHSVYASACAVAHKSIPPIIEDLVQVVGGAVDVAEYALPGTPELALNAVKALSYKNGVLLANHGVVGCGRSLSEALTACELMEKAAQIFINAVILGGPKMLSDSDVAIMHKFYLEQYCRDGL